MRLIRIPSWVQFLYPQYLWRFPTEEKCIYLSFDDGPSPEVTEWVLEQLAEYQAKATFFLIGDKVRQHPEIVHKVIDHGHTIGHHTYNHLNGWKTEHKRYLKNVMKGYRTLAEYTGVRSRLFRPPYAKINRAQGKALSKFFDIVMMDVISYDFDTKLGGDECFNNVVKHADEGSIIVFHDSQKAWERLSYALPKVLHYYHERGFSFKALEKGPVKEEMSRSELVGI